MKRLTAHTNIRLGQRGFTILELMIATSVFSVILLVAAAGILSFTNKYYKGVTASTTQAAARAVLSDITQNIQLSSGSVLSDVNNGVGFICVNGSQQYAFRLGGPVVGSGNRHAMVKDSDSACENADVLGQTTLNATQREMLGDHMRLATFDVTPGPAARTPTYIVHIRLIYGEYDLMTINGHDLTAAQDVDAQWWANNGSQVTCKSTVGSQFCAVSDLSTTVQVRVL